MTGPSRRRFLRRVGVATAVSFAGCPDGTADSASVSPGRESPSRPGSDSPDGGTEEAISPVLSRRGTPERESQTASPVSDAIVWNRTVDSSVVTTPAIDAERVYVGVTEGNVIAVDAATGSRVWSASVPARLRDMRLVDGALVVVSGTNELRAGHTVHGFDPETGAERWTTNPTDWSLDVLGAHGGTVYVATEDDVPTAGNETLYAISATDGATAWSGTVGEVETGATTADSVYVAGYRHVDAFDAVAGEKRWSNSVTDESSVDYGDEEVSVLRADEETVVYAYQPDDNDITKVLVGVDAGTGDERWRSDSRSAVSSAVVRDGVVYADLDGVVALDTHDGAVRWEDSSHGVVTAGGITDDRIYAGGYDVHAYDRETGEIDWTWEPTPSLTGVFPAGIVSGTLLLEVSPDPAFSDRYKFGVDIESGESRWVFTEGTGLTNLAVWETLAVTGGENGRLYAFQ